jgi:hypothetical protein
MVLKKVMVQSSLGLAAIGAARDVVLHAGSESEVTKAKFLQPVRVLQIDLNIKVHSVDETLDLPIVNSESRSTLPQCPGKDQPRHGIDPRLLAAVVVTR